MAENLPPETSLSKNKDGASRAPGSHTSDQPKRGRGRRRKDLNAGTKASKSDLPPAAFEGAGEVFAVICWTQTLATVSPRIVLKRCG